MKFHIGAGTLITVLLALSIGGYQYYQQHRSAAQPPVVERQLLGSTPHGIAPTPEFLLAHRSDLGLNDEQAQQIRTCASAYRHDIAPYQQQIQIAYANVEKKMERKHGDTRLSNQQLAQATNDVQRLSSIMATTRHAYWQQACALLTAPQRAKADQLATHATIRDLGP